MLARHVRYDTQLVVMASSETGETSLIAVDDPRFRQQLEQDLRRGLRALGLVAFDRDGKRRGEGRYRFPWLQSDPDGEDAFERICGQRTRAAL